jgi:hypothetical protein
MLSFFLNCRWSFCTPNEFLRRPDPNFLSNRVFFEPIGVLSLSPPEPLRPRTSSLARLSPPSPNPHTVAA